MNVKKVWENKQKSGTKDLAPQLLYGKSVVFCSG